MNIPKGRLTINSHTIEILPRYVETDQGGRIHHSVYPIWMEMGRTELLRANGISYRQLEEEDIYFVVAELNIKYRSGCFYDQKVLLTTTCSKITPAKIEHTYTFKSLCDGRLIAESRTILACINGKGKVQRIPEFMYPAHE